MAQSGGIKGLFVESYLMDVTMAFGLCLCIILLCIIFLMYNRVRNKQQNLVFVSLFSLKTLLALYNFLLYLSAMGH